MRSRKSAANISRTLGSLIMKQLHGFGEYFLDRMSSRSDISSSSMFKSKFSMYDFRRLCLRASLYALYRSRRSSSGEIRKGMEEDLSINSETGRTDNPFSRFQLLFQLPLPQLQLRFYALLRLPANGTQSGQPSDMNDREKLAFLDISIKTFNYSGMRTQPQNTRYSAKIVSNMSILAGNRTFFYKSGVI